MKYFPKGSASKDSSLLSMKVRIFNAFWNNSRDGLCLFDKDLNFLDINRFALRDMHKRKENVLRKNILEVFPYLKESGRFKRYKKVIKTGKPYVAELPNPCKKDSQIYVFAFKVLDGLGMIVSDVTKFHAYKTDLSNSYELLRSLSFHNQVLREEEAKRIAREIHDELAPTLTTFKMDLFWFLSWLRTGGIVDPAVGAKISAMTNLVDRTISSTRKICSELRPALLDDLGLLDALEWQVNEYRKSSGLQCRLRVSCDGMEFSPDLSSCIFRVFQEAFTNIVRHARATKAFISLSKIRSKNILRLNIRDNGRGILPGEISSPKSFGLIGMKERLSPYGGRLKISGLPGKGTAITVSIPLTGSPSQNGCVNGKNSNSR